MLLVETLPVGALQCNCTIIACPDTREAIVVDPGGDPDRILEIVRHYDVTVRYAVHTHAHLDHIGATRDIKEQTGSSIALHEGDRFLYDGYLLQARLFGLATPTLRDVLPIDRFLVDGDEVEFGRRKLVVLHTPGHTPGSLSFFLDDADHPLVLAGDTLFRRSIGRTDLPGGDYPTIERSIRDRLYTLAGETRVICGHGPDTSIEAERRSNPFIHA